MDPKTDKAWAGDVACCGVNNRGVALWKDKVISITLDGRLIAINKATGEIVWERKIADPAIAETLTAAPLIVRDIAIVDCRSEEHTSELQSLRHLVCRLLLEKKKSCIICGGL